MAKPVGGEGEKKPSEATHQHQLTLADSKSLHIQNDFPLYSVAFDDIRGLVIVGGGGGPSKSGIGNGMVLCAFTVCSS